MNVRFQETGWGVLPGLTKDSQGDESLAFEPSIEGLSPGRDKMYLTKIDLIPQQRGIRQALGDCQQLHQMIMGLFESDRKSSGVIYRVREDRYALAI